MNIYAKYLFKENKFTSNVDVINIDIEKRTYKEMAERFWSVKKDTCFLFQSNTQLACCGDKKLPR